MKKPYFRIILKNTLAQGVGKSVNLVFALATTMVLRRTLKRAGFGEYIFIISLVTILVTLADFGTHLVGVREASKRERKREVLGNVILLRSLFSLATTLILGILYFTPLKIKPIPLLITAFLLPVLSFRTSLNLFFHARLELEKYALIEAAHSLLFFLLVLLGRMLEKGLNFFLLSLAISNLLVLLFFTFYFQSLRKRLVYFKDEKRLEFKTDTAFLKKFFQEALPMGGILVLFTLYSRLGSVLLKVIKGEEAVGIYGLSFKIYENLTMPAAFLMNAYLPLISKEAQRLTVELKPPRRDVRDSSLVAALPPLNGGGSSPDANGRDRFAAVELKSLLKSALFLLLGTVLFLMLATFVFAPFIIKVLAGTQTEPEIFALRLLIPALFFAYLNHLTGYSLLALGKQRKSFLINLGALVFNFFANLLFIPQFSFKAASFNIVLTEILVFVLSAKVLFNYLKSKGVDI